MAANAIDLCLAADVASDLGISTSATVDRLVTSASRAIAQYCSRVFQKSTGIVEYPAAYGRPYLMLERAPILAITSITDRGGVVDSSDYECVGKNVDSGMVFRKRGSWFSTARFTGNVSQTLEYFQGSTEDLVVTYDAGYVTPGQHLLDGATYPTVTLPEDLQEAARLTAAAYYRRLGVDPNVVSESLGDWSVSYFKNAFAGAGSIPEAAAAMVADYILFRAS